MKKITIHRPGYRFMIYSNGIGSLLIAFCIVSLFISKDSEYKLLSNNVLWTSLGVVSGVFLITYLISLLCRRFRIEGKIKELLKLGNKSSYMVLKALFITDKLYYNTDSKLICKVVSYEGRDANFLLFTKKDIKSIEPFVKKSDSSKKKQNSLKYTQAGALMGGLGGAIGGALIDSAFTKEEDNSFEIGIFLRLTNDEFYKLSLGYKSHKEEINKKLNEIKNVINKIRNG